MPADTEQAPPDGRDRGPVGVTGPLLFYDGDCALCSRFVAFVLRHDPAGRFRFAPLAGPTFAALGLPLTATYRDTTVLRDESGIHVRSDAALRTLAHLNGWPAALGRLGLLVPRFGRDPVYRLVAALRHHLARGAQACRVPAPGETTRFLP